MTHPRMPEDQTHSEGHSKVAKSSGALRPEFDVLDLVGVGGEVHLRHNDQIYTLRITRAGKLILTK